MAWYLSQSLAIEQYDSANNQTLYRTRVYLGATGYNAYSGGYAAAGSGNVDGQNFSWTGPTAAELNNSTVEIYTNTFWVSGSTDTGSRGTISAAATFNGGGGYAPGQISASATAPGFDYDLKPATAGAVTAVVNADKTITVSVASTASRGYSTLSPSPTFYLSYSIDGGSTWSAEVSGTGTLISGRNFSYSQVFSGLTKGKTYIFRAYATNTDGTGGTTTSSSVFLPSGGRIYDGSTWPSTTTAKIHNGTTWVDLATAKVHNGTTWVDLS